MLITFVIPSYNQSIFIKECLDSILDQGLLKDIFEVIVIDGGSADGTVDILEKHPVVTEWISEPDLGHWDALNKGIQKSHGEWIAWINSDDFYFLGAFSKVLNFINENPDADIVYCDAEEVDENSDKIGDYLVEPWDYERLIDRCIICQPATIIRKSVFDMHGGLSAKCQVAIDLEYWLRVGKKVNFVRFPFKLAASRLWAGTKSNNEQLAMQEDALYFGKLYGGRWSRRRIGAVAEARLLKLCPSFSPDDKGSKRLFFFGFRSLFYIFLEAQCRLGLFRLRK